jgi:hypothetical protein
MGATFLHDRRSMEGSVDAPAKSARPFYMKILYAAMAAPLRASDNNSQAQICVRMIPCSHTKQCRSVDASNEFGRDAARFHSI